MGLEAPEQDLVAEKIARIASGNSSSRLGIRFPVREFDFPSGNSFSRPGIRVSFREPSGHAGKDPFEGPSLKPIGADWIRLSAILSEPLRLAPLQHFPRILVGPLTLQEV